MCREPTCIPLGFRLRTANKCREGVGLKSVVHGLTATLLTHCGTPEQLPPLGGRVVLAGGVLVG